MTLLEAIRSNGPKQHQEIWVDAIEASHLRDFLAKDLAELSARDIKRLKLEVRGVGAGLVERLLRTKESLNKTSHIQG